MIPKFPATLLAILVVGSVPAGFAQTEAQTTKLDGSLVFARGSYGLATDTDVFIALVSPTFESGDWRLQANLPYVHLKGPATVVGNTGNTAVSHSASGVGDAAVSVGRKLLSAEDGWTTWISAKLKLPTADEARGLGTGKSDESLQVDFLKQGGGITPFATIGYQVLGHSTAYPMKSGFFVTGGVASKVASADTVGLAANWRERTVSQGEQAFEVMLFAQHDLSPSSHVQVFVMRGFTDASPENTLGVTLGLKF